MDLLAQDTDVKILGYSHFFPKRYYYLFVISNAKRQCSCPNLESALPSSWHQLQCSTARVLQMMADTSCSWDAMFASVSTWPWGATALHQLMPNPWNNEVYYLSYLSLRIFIFTPYRYTYHIYVYIYIIIGKYVAYDVYLRWSKVDSTRIWLRHGCDAFAWCVSNSGCCLLWNSNSNGPVVIVVFGCHKFMLESIDEVTSKCLSSSPWLRKWGSTSVSLRGQKNIDNIWRISAQKDTNCRIPAQNQGSNKVGDLEFNLYMHYSIWILEFVGTGLVQWLHCLGLESGLCSKVMAIMALMIFSLWGTNFRFSWH